MGQGALGGFVTVRKWARHRRWATTAGRRLVVRAALSLCAKGTSCTLLASSGRRDRACLEHHPEVIPNDPMFSYAAIGYAIDVDMLD